MRSHFIFLITILLSLFPQLAPTAPHKTRHVFLITTDGLRPEEVFTGAEEALLDKKAGVKNVPEMRQRFWRESETERRQALLPFIWSTVAQRGAIIGNYKKGSIARVSNGLNFSYPGYNEMLAGFPDPAINSNDKKPNQNVTVLEWLNQNRAFKNKVAAFCTWDVFPYIVNTERSGVFMQTNWETIPLKSKRGTIIQELIRDTTPIWENMTVDSLMFHSMMEYIDQEKPRVVFFSLGETDEWAHEGRYDQYLRSAFMFDEFLRRLWAYVQRDIHYKDRTTFIITTDHGRGHGPDKWRDHGKDVAGAENIWLAILGPDTPALGECQDQPGVTQSQVAATIAAYLREDYRAFQPKAAPPIPFVLR